MLTPLSSPLGRSNSCLSKTQLLTDQNNTKTPDTSIQSPVSDTFEYHCISPS